MVKIYLYNLNCTHCAERIEEAVGKLSDVKNVEFNFINKLMQIDTDTDEHIMYNTVKNIVDSIEDGVDTQLANENKITLVLENLNCTHCAARIEDAVKNLDTVSNVEFNFINKHMDITTSEDKYTVLKTVKTIVDSIEDGVNTKLLEEAVSKTEDKEDNFIKKSIVRLVVGGLLFAGGLAFENSISTASIICFILSYIVFGYDVILRALKNISKGQIFDENFLMSIATIAAFIIGEYREAVAVMLFYQIGEFLQSLAVDRSKRSIKNLMSLNIDSVAILKDGKLENRDPKDIAIGDIISIKNGEKIPVDGIIISGSTTLDMKALTGESVPVVKNEGDSVLSGSINEGSVISVRAEKLYEDSTVAKILDMVENAVGKKSKTESFISKFAKIYTPIVVFAALFIAVIPILLGYDANTWIYRALVFLVSSCPCALVVSVPLTFFSGIGAMSKNGVLIKGSNYLQLLSELDAIAMDKTGTITMGKFSVTEVTGEDTLKYAASLEKYSSHPIAVAIVDAYKGDLFETQEQKEIAGYGITAVIDGKKVAVGNGRLMESLNIKNYNNKYNIFVVVGDNLIGEIKLDDSIKSDSVEAVEELKKLGVVSITMLTGDKKEIAEEVASKAGIDNVFSELLPQDKVAKLEDICEKNKVVAAVGDGINDAPLLARADIGIAMGGIGSDAAIEAADIVVMDDMLSKIPQSIKAAQYTLKVCKQNVVFVVAVKAIVLVLAVLGIANMWLAVFADVGTALIAVLNSIKIIKK